TVSDTADLKLLPSFLSENKLPVFVLGGGSNVLFTRDFDGIVIKNDCRGKRVISETDETVTLEVQAGEIWTDLVDFCVEKGWGGIENLVSVPGTVGGASVQNIGAYGAEFSQVIQSVSTFHLITGQRRNFTTKECQYGYRKSIFKTQEYKDLLVVNATITLCKKPVLKTEYGTINNELQKRNITRPCLSDIRDVVAAIRSEKLPDVKVLGSAGSFFKNPEVAVEVAQTLQQQYPQMPVYPIDAKTVKLAAGWLIDQCGLRGFRMGDAGIHDKQSLVIVNHKNATSAEILQLMEKVQSTVKQKFGIDLLPEVVMVG
ncbi:MAG: UDP-N-acetylmuramate dehydrogenase, partial [Bacteroidales bacterium]|nr:UDP-N-acetylmuramate dehydrogenase [Bacteroidales bacterium]